MPRVAAIFLPRSSPTERSGLSLATTSAVHSGRENRYTVLIGLPFARASNAALPAVEPNWIAFAAKKLLALFEPSDSTQLTFTPLFASAASSAPLLLRIKLGGL